MGMKRREFLKALMLATGLLALDHFPYHLYAGKTSKYANDKIMLGNTGIEVSRLAVGTGTRGIHHQSNQTRSLGVQGLSDLLYAAYDEGVFFWDSADQYGTHEHLKEALRNTRRGYNLAFRNFNNLAPD